MPDQFPWILLSYKIAPEPVRHRMAVWRKLKALGTVYLQNGICLLPMNADHLRQARMLAHEIAEMGGDAVLLEAAPLDPAQQERVVARFRADRDEAYREFLERCEGFEAEIARETAARKLTYAELEENDEDLKKLRAWHTKIAALDFYGAPLAAETRARLEQCEARLEAFANEVFEAQAAKDGQPDGSPVMMPAAAAILPFDGRPGTIRRFRRYGQGCRSP
jgi:Protein ChrB, N-terminal